MEDNELRVLAQPIVNALQNESNPYCAVIITSDAIRLVSTEISIPVTETAAP